MAEGGSLASIIVRITADATDFVEGLRKASKETKEFAKAGAELGAVGTAMLGALTAATEHAAKFGAEIYGVQKRTGLAAAEISGLKLAAEASGQGLDAITVGMKKLATATENAANGHKEAVQLFNRLGISATDAAGKTKPLAEIFHESSDALSKVTNTTDKAAAASALFGRGGLALLPVLASGTAGLNKWTEEAEKLGVSVTDSQAAQSKAFMLAQHSAEQAFSGITMTIGTVFIPTLTKLAETVTGALVRVREWIAVHPQLTQLIGNLSLALAGGGGLLVAIAGVIGGIGLLTGALGSLASSLALATGGLSLIIGLAYSFRNELAQIITLVGSGLAKAFASMAGTMATAAGAVGLGGLHDRLMTMKFSLEETSKSWGDMSEQFSHDVPEVTALTGALQKLTDEGLGKGEPKVSKFRQSVNALIESVTEETKKGPALVAALTELEGKHVSMDLIVNKLGNQTMEYAATLEHLPPAVFKVVEAFIAHEKAANAAHDTIRRITEANKEAMGSYSEGLSGTGDTTDKLNRDLINGVIANGDKDLQKKRPLPTMDMEAFGDTFNKLTARSKLFIDATKLHSEKWKQDWLQVQDDIKSSAGHIFDDMFQKGKSVFQSLSDFIKSTFQTLLRTLFQQSVTAMLTGVGGNGGIAGAMSSLFGKSGDSGGSGGGLLGAITGGISKVFGKKPGAAGFSDALSETAGGVFSGASSIVGSATRTASSGAGGLAGFMGGPWGAAVGIGVSVLGGLIGGLLQHKEINKSDAAIQAFNAQTLWFNTTSPFEMTMKKLNDTLSRLDYMSPGDVVTAGVGAARGAVTRAVGATLQSDPTLRRQIGGTLLESAT